MNCCKCGGKVEWIWSDMCIECTDEDMWLMALMQDNKGGEVVTDGSF